MTNNFDHRDIGNLVFAAYRALGGVDSQLGKPLIAGQNLVNVSLSIARTEAVLQAAQPKAEPAPEPKPEG
jgi:hypothetical protein